MISTHLSRCEVFQAIAATSCHEWPVYDSTPLYDRNSLRGLKGDARTVLKVRFEHDAHEPVELRESRLQLDARA